MGEEVGTMQFLEFKRGENKNFMRKKDKKNDD
jgi:hypothetical protein